MSSKLHALEKSLEGNSLLPSITRGSGRGHEPQKRFTHTLSGSVRSWMSMWRTEREPSLRLLFSLTYFTKDPPGKSRGSDDKVKKEKAS